MSELAFVAHSAARRSSEEGAWRLLTASGSKQLVLLVGRWHVARISKGMIRE